MAVPKLQIGREARAPNRDWLGYIGGLGERLSLAENPLEILAAALVEVRDLLGADECRLRDHAAEPATPPDASAIVRNGVSAIAVIDVIRGAGAMVDAETEQALLEAIAAVTGLALGRSTLLEQLDAARKVARDLDSAARLQRSLQADSDPDEMPIWGLNLPAHQLSGDFFDFCRLDDGRIAFALGDVSGKGVNAALLMAKTVSLFRCLAKRIDSPAELLAVVNGELCETAAHGMFVTMVAGHYRPRSGEVTFANAGHQPPLLRRPDRSYEGFPATAPPLGILPSMSVGDEDIELAGGEFYVFTDGLTEYRYADGEELGAEGLIQLIEAFAKESPARRLDLILETLDREGGWVARDDLTVLAIDDAWVRKTGLDAAVPDDVRPPQPAEADL